MGDQQPAVEDVHGELKDHWSSDTPPSLDELARAISNRAVALCQLLWTSCTRREKLVLVQLSQEGFVTPQSVEVVEALIAKGLSRGSRRRRRRRRQQHERWV